MTLHMASYYSFQIFLRICFDLSCQIHFYQYFPKSKKNYDESVLSIQLTQYILITTEQDQDMTQRHLVNSFDISIRHVLKVCWSYETETPREKVWQQYQAYIKGGKTISKTVTYICKTCSAEGRVTDCWWQVRRIAGSNPGMAK